MMSKVSEKHKIVVCSILIILASLGKTAGMVAPSDGRPNIIYILVDDMGYSDLGCYGGEISTPNLDRLAKNGLKMRSFYNNARCCPTRASLLTGRYPHEVGMGHMVSLAGSSYQKGSYQGFLDSSFPTIAEYLKSAGYSTYMAGKWHVGERQEHWPRKRGFEYFFGLINGASGYYGVIPQEKGKRQVVLGDREAEISSTGFYMTDELTDYAMKYVDRHTSHTSSGPFFLYLAYTAPHFPLHAREEEILKYESVYKQGWDLTRKKRFDKMKELGLIDSRFEFPDRPADIAEWTDVSNKDEWVRKMAVYAAMIDRLDQNIGRLVKKLDENKVLDNTLIVFVSDNGACAEDVSKRNYNDPKVKIGEPGSYVSYDVPWANVSNTPFRKYKRYLHEGGVISPCIISWPGKIAPQEGYHSAPAFVIDLVPTALELAGLPVEGLPGQAMSFLWTNKSTPVRTYCWEHEGNKAIRRGKWKLVKDKEDSGWALYDLERDPAETEDRSAGNEGLADELKWLYAEWSHKVGVKPE